MKALSKNQILKTTHCMFYLWSTQIDPCEVTKKALRRSLRSVRKYSAEITEVGKWEYGTNAGKSYYSCIIML